MDKVWKKFDENNPPKPDKFLAVISGYNKPHIEIVEKVNFWGNIAYSNDHGNRTYPKRILRWTEIPEYKGEYK